MSESPPTRFNGNLLVSSIVANLFLTLMSVRLLIADIVSLWLAGVGVHTLPAKTTTESLKDKLKANERIELDTLHVRKGALRGLPFKTRLDVLWVTGVITLVCFGVNLLIRDLGEHFISIEGDRFHLDFNIYFGMGLGVACVVLQLNALFFTKGIQTFTMSALCLTGLLTWFITFSVLSNFNVFRLKVLAGHDNLVDWTLYINKMLDFTIPVMDEDTFASILVNFLSVFAVIFYFSIHEQAVYYLAPYTNNVSKAMLADSDDKKYYNAYYRTSNCIVDHLTFLTPLVISTVLIVTPLPQSQPYLQLIQPYEVKTQYILVGGLAVYLCLRMANLKNHVTHSLNQSIRIRDSIENSVRENVNLFADDKDQKELRFNVAVKILRINVAVIARKLCVEMIMYHTLTLFIWSVLAVAFSSCYISLPKTVANGLKLNPTLEIILTFLLHIISILSIVATIAELVNSKRKPVVHVSSSSNNINNTSSSSAISSPDKAKRSGRSGGSAKKRKTPKKK